MLEVCSGVTNEKEKDEMYERSWSDSGQKGRERQELRYVLNVRACACGLNLVVLLLCSSELIDLNQLNELICWERAHPLL